MSLLVTLVPIGAQAASKVTPIEAKAVSVAPTSVRITWKHKKRVAKWKVQTAFEKNYNAGTFHTVATVSGKKTAYTVKGLKKNCLYYFRVLGYRRKKGKTVLVYRTYSNDVPGYSGITYPVWDDYAYTDAYYSINRIDIWLGLNYYGLKPTGIELYRKNAGAPDSSYREIADISTSSDMKYSDKKIKAGMAYVYRARAYRKIKGKRIYSVWSAAMTKSACEQHGVFGAEKISASDDGTSLVVKLTSVNRYNASLVLIDKGMDVFTRDEKISEDGFLPLSLAEYSLDGTTWKSLSDEKNGIALKGGESIYLRLTGTSGAENADSVIATSISYNGIPSYLEISFGSIAETDINSEEIH